MKHYFMGCLAALLVVSGALAATVTIRPDGQGAHSAWSQTGCAAGTSEWQCVDEAVANTSDRLQTGTNNAKETFTFGSTGLVGNTINSVTLYYYAQRVKAADACFAAMTRASSTDYLSGVQMCSTAAYATYSHTYATNPATGSAWTISEVDALEAGMYGLDANGGGRVAQVYAVVDYNASVCGNNIRETGEACDGTDLNSRTCSSQGFSGGTLSCAGDCSGFVTTGCYTSTCADTDGGFNVFTQGTVSGNSSNSSYAYTDVCFDLTTVTEYFCSGSTWSSFNIGCNGTNNSCSAGACLP